MMTSEHTWYMGKDNFQKCTFVPGNDNNQFTVELLENDFESDRDLEIILKDNLQSLNTNNVEILFSGGVDSELLLLICKKYKINCTAVTMQIYLDDLLYNTHDLYYTEKFLRSNDINHRFVKIDALEFFNSGRYLNYIVPYNIDEPHVATHLWLIDQCYDFPVFGGDWPWVHNAKKNKVISPYRLSYHNYENYMRDKGINGIGNMLGYSFESLHKLMQLHMIADDILAPRNKNHISASVKQHMFNLSEPRIRSYGWDRAIAKLNFDINSYKKEVYKYIKPTIPKIIWGQKICNLLNTPLTENETFE